MKNPFPTLLLLIGSSLFFNACHPVCDCVPPQESMVNTLLHDSDLSTLRALMERAGLNDTLENRPALTLFAPTNAAWETYRGTSGYLTLADIPIADLKQLLNYHLVGSVVRAENIPESYLASLAPFSTTTNLLKLKFHTSGTWLVNGTPVTSGDLPTTNGVIYPIERVLDLPTVVSALQVNPDFSTFVLALNRVDLGIDYLATLGSNGPFTVFAPTNAAFTTLISELGYANLDGIPADQLNAILQYHIVSSANLASADLIPQQGLTTLGGKKLMVISGTRLVDQQGSIANVVTPDIQTVNGVLHSLDKVMRPN